MTSSPANENKSENQGKGITGKSGLNLNVFKETPDRARSECEHSASFKRVQAVHPFKLRLTFIIKNLNKEILAWISLHFSSLQTRSNDSRCSLVIRKLLTTRGRTGLENSRQIFFVVGRFNLKYGQTLLFN